MEIVCHERIASESFFGKKMAGSLEERRGPNRIRHLRHLLAAPLTQRVHGMVLDYGDANYPDSFHHDSALKTARAPCRYLAMIWHRSQPFSDWRMKWRPERSSRTKAPSPDTLPTIYRAMARPSIALASVCRSAYLMSMPIGMPQARRVSLIGAQARRSSK